MHPPVTKLQPAPQAAYDAAGADLGHLRNELFLLEPAVSATEQGAFRPADARDSTYRRLLGISDILATVAALILTATLTNTAQVYWSMFLCVLAVVPVCKLLGLYDRDAHLLHRTTLDELPKLGTAAVLIAASAFVARDLAVRGEPGIGTAQLVFLCVCLIAAFGIGRVISRRVARAVTATERLLVVGSDQDTERLARKLAVTGSVKAEIVGRVPIAYSELPNGHSRVLGEHRDLKKVIRTYRIDRMVVIPGNRNPDEVSDVLRAAKSVGVKVSMLPGVFDAVGFAVETDDISGLQLMGVRDARMTSSSILIKRSVDVIGAGVAFILVAPIFAVVAAAIKLDSKGPVFYRQKRVGRDGETFEMIKFRTMRVGADRERAALSAMNESNGLFKIADDPRVTRVGKLLRKLSIDEIPQLINVLKGEMSIVGPRPLVPDEDVAITGWYRRRGQITPGITGIWQLYGPMRSDLDEMAKLDYLYVANWSLWSDIKIMFRTVNHVAGRRGI